MSLLTVKNLRTELLLGKNKVPVVDGLSFELNEGKTLAIVGESGCGKSMTGLSLLRILPQPPALDSTGEVWYRGKNLLTISEKKMRNIRGKGIGMIFQDPSTSLNPVYPVGDQILETIKLHLDLSDEEALALAISSMKDVGIPTPEERMYEYPHQLSGGMKQRVMIAMALVCEPDILIADEPTTALDVTIQAQVLDLIAALQKKKGTAVLFITHDIGVVAEIADDVIVMYASHAMEKGSVKEIFTHPANPYTQALFASRPSYRTKGSYFETIKGSVPPPTSYPSGCRFHPRCAYIMEKCKKADVPEFPILGTHSSKCWLSEKT